MPDPRERRGVRHRVNTVLALAVCAVLAGCRSFTAIGEWAAGASEQALAALGVGGCAPCDSTIRRVLQAMHGDELDIAIGAWAAASTVPSARPRLVAVDGSA